MSFCLFRCQCARVHSRGLSASSCCLSPHPMTPPVAGLHARGLPRPHQKRSSADLQTTEKLVIFFRRGF